MLHCLILTYENRIVVSDGHQGYIPYSREAKDIIVGDKNDYLLLWHKEVKIFSTFVVQSNKILCTFVVQSNINFVYFYDAKKEEYFLLLWCKVIRYCELL